LTTQMGGQMGGQTRSRHFFVRLELTTRQWKILTTPKCPPPSRQLFSPHTPPKYLSSHRHTMAAEPLAAPLHISVNPWLIVTKLEESIV